MGKTLLSDKAIFLSASEKKSSLLSAERNIKRMIEDGGRMVKR